MMYDDVVICINQHLLSNISSSIHEKVKQHCEAKLKKGVYKKGVYFLVLENLYSLMFQVYFLFF